MLEKGIGMRAGVIIIPAIFAPINVRDRERLSNNKGDSKVTAEIHMVNKMDGVVDSDCYIDRHHCTHAQFGSIYGFYGRIHEYDTELKTGADR